MPFYNSTSKHCFGEFRKKKKQRINLLVSFSPFPHLIVGNLNSLGNIRFLNEQQNRALDMQKFVDIIII